MKQLDVIYDLTFSRTRCDFDQSLRQVKSASWIIQKVRKGKDRDGVTIKKYHTGKARGEIRFEDERDKEVWERGILYRKSQRRDKEVLLGGGRWEI